jgi:hypothetical protein
MGAGVLGIGHQVFDLVPFDLIGRPGGFLRLGILWHWEALGCVGKHFRLSLEAFLPEHVRFPGHTGMSSMPPGYGGRSSSALRKRG